MNLIHYRAFDSYFPFNMLTEVQQLDGLGSSIFALMQWYDISYILIIIIFIGGYYNLDKHFISFSFKKHACIVATYIVITFLPVGAMIKIMNWPFGQWHSAIIWQCDASPIKSYQAFGLLPIMSYQYWDTTTSIISLSDEEAQIINNAVSCQLDAYNRTSDRFSIKPRRNIVIMLMESLNSNAISYMPTLDSLRQLNTSLYCHNVAKLSQGGISIGGQLTVMTGLNGLRQSIYCTDYPNNIYPSIVSLLKNRCNTFSSFAVISTVRHFYRQDKVNKAFSIDFLYDKNDCILKHNRNRWADDNAVFECAIRHLPTDNSPFGALIVPSNMHVPYTHDTTIVCDANLKEITDLYLHEYMRRARYLDDQIAAFINELKTRGLYDDTLIVVTSDHQVPTAYLKNEEAATMKESLSPYIPAIFINTGADWTEQNERNKDVVFCHSQVYPTMLQLMGLRPEKYAGLFPPMTNIEATQEYDFANCAYETTTDKRIKQIYDIEEKIIRSSYFGVME